MILKEEIEKIASVKAHELNGCIVDVTIGTGNDIVVYFDKKGGVQIQECVTISKSINDYFDRDIEDYALTVCSPGLTNPFKIKAQYEINKGREIIVKKSDGKKVSGTIVSSDNQLTLAVKKKEKGSRNKYVVNDLMIPFNEIKETRLKIKFK
jgi:ribosome maturation factor RimP